MLKKVLSGFREREIYHEIIESNLSFIRDIINFK